MVGDKVYFYHCSMLGVIIIVTLINAAVWGTENQSTVANLCYFASKIYTKKNTTTAKLQYVNDDGIYRSAKRRCFRIICPNVCFRVLC